MSAMPATELTCDSDIELVRALRSVGVLSGLRQDDPGDTPGPQRTAPASRRDTPDVRHAALTPRRDTPAARSGRPRDTPVAPLRLTRRGRVVVALAAALLVTVVSLLLARRGAGDERRSVSARGAGEPRPGDRPPGPEPVVGGRERGSRPGHPRRHPADHRPQFAERRHCVRRPAALGPARLSPRLRPNTRLIRNALSPPAAALVTTSGRDTPARRPQPHGGLDFRVRPSRPLAS